MSILEIDGSQGEGGGQILRSSLSLSMLTGRAIQIRKIRAGRSKPGLMRQHLVCVDAARALCHGFAEGAELGSTALSFTPNALAAGDYHFDIGSAGSTMLVLQTVLPAMLKMSEPCSVSLRGGTHNPLAPSADFFTACFLPQLQAMGAHLQFEVEALGLFPSGRGQVTLRSQPQAVGARLIPPNLMQRLGHARLSVHAITAAVPAQIGERELSWLRASYAQEKDFLPIETMHCSEAPHTGPGNVLGVTVQFDNVAEHVTEFGRRGLPAEDVAKAAREGVARYLHSGAVVGEHLADQLLLPMLLAGGGEFVTAEPSEHLRTNAQVLEAFGVAKIHIEPLPKRKESSVTLWRVTLET